MNSSWRACCTTSWETPTGPPGVCGKRACRPRAVEIVEAVTNQASGSASRQSTAARAQLWPAADRNDVEAIVRIVNPSLLAELDARC